MLDVAQSGLEIVSVCLSPRMDETPCSPFIVVPSHSARLLPDSCMTLRSVMGFSDLSDATSYALS